ncbi:MAG: hypothetical protein CMN30_24800 [Sandaracinus sp.]|nr:hypothetical protein [Sandaracinus sp.]|tara:strand:+ start:5934 stop:6311 length:378 start_codon:yes stop_codon:yes gene_type:complete
MNAEEARDLFSEAYDGVLEGPEREAFDAALDADAELRAEYEELAALLDEAHGLGEVEGDVPDLLPGVQKKLRERSKGRYYRDRFALQTGFSWTPIILAFVMLGLMGLAYAGLHFVQELEATSESP